MRLGFSLILFCFVGAGAAGSEAGPFPAVVEALSQLCERKLLSTTVPQVKALGAQTIMERFVEGWGQRDSAKFGYYLTMTYQSHQIGTAERARAEKLGQHLGVAYFDELVHVQTLKFPERGFGPETIEAFISALSRATADSQNEKKVLILEFPPHWDIVSQETLHLVLDGGRFLGIENGRHLVVVHIHGPSFPRLPLSLREGLYLLNWDTLAIRGTDQFEIWTSEMYGGDLTESNHVIVPPR